MNRGTIRMGLMSVCLVSCILLGISACGDKGAEADNKPVADFTLQPLSGEAPLTVKCMDQSKGDIDSWFWAFDETWVSRERNPSHTFQTVGNHSVRLEVSGPDGSDQMARTVTVDQRSCWEVSTINFPILGPYWPIKVQNSCDCDFDHHRPHVRLVAQIYIDDSGSKIRAQVGMSAREDSQDCTEARGWWDFLLWTAPEETRINRILSPTNASIEYVDDDRVYEVFEFPLCNFRCMGETEGDDVCEYGRSDGTHFLVDFKQINLELCWR